MAVEPLNNFKSVLDNLEAGLGHTSRFHRFVRFKSVVE